VLVLIIRIVLIVLMCNWYGFGSVVMGFFAVGAWRVRTVPPDAIASPARLR